MSPFHYQYSTEIQQVITSIIIFYNSDAGLVNLFNGPRPVMALKVIMNDLNTTLLNISRKTD